MSVMKPRYFKFEVFEQESILENKKQTKKMMKLMNVEKLSKYFTMSCGGLLKHFSMTSKILFVIAKIPKMIGV